MLLAHKFENPQVNLSLEVFLREVTEYLGEQLVSVVLFGSIVFDDLAPGYGDLDFLAVVRDDMTEDTLNGLIELRKPLRTGEYGVYCSMIEGPFLSRRMLDPRNTGRTVCWGTGGERWWERNRLGWFVHHIIAERGVVIWGEDVRHQIPAPGRDQLLDEVRAACDDLRDNGRGVGLHSVDWLLLAARLLLWLREGGLTSKSGAADWAFTNASGDWRELLPRAKGFRLNPSLANSPEAREWLTALDAPIRQACEELESELGR